MRIRFPGAFLLAVLFSISCFAQTPKTAVKAAKGKAPAAAAAKISERGQEGEIADGFEFGHGRRK